MSYLLLVFVGVFLHNHSVFDSPLLQAFICKGNFCSSLAYDDSCHGEGSKHKHHKSCPVCHFKAVVVGLILIQSIVVLGTLFCFGKIFSQYSSCFFSFKYSNVSLRAPPFFSF